MFVFEVVRVDVLGHSCVPFAPESTKMAENVSLIGYTRVSKADGFG